MRRSLAVRIVLLVFAAAAVTGPVRAEDEEEAVVAARRAFVSGTELVKHERWGEALAAFERANKLKPHAITLFNIGQCERAAGHYTRARRALLDAVAHDDASGRVELAESARTDAEALLAEIDGLLPRVSVKLAPEDASVAVDGRPLERLAPSRFVAGTMAPGRGEPPGSSTFEVLVDPGSHVFVVSRQGYQDVLVNRTLSPGVNAPLALELDRLPATFHVTSNVEGAVARVNDVDVGNPPVDVSRVAGRHRVVVEKRGFVTYEADVVVRPGERVELAANLRPESRALTREWWFWTGVGVLVAGAATGTYFLARSDSATRPPPNGGGLGWNLRVP